MYLNEPTINIRAIMHRGPTVKKKLELIRGYERSYRDIKQAKRFMDGCMQAGIRDMLSSR